MPFFWNLKVLTCTSKVLRPPTELLPADYQNKSFEHGNLTPYVKYGQNNCLDLTELNKYLYLESRDIYLSHIQAGVYLYIST